MIHNRYLCKSCIINIEKFSTRIRSVTHQQKMSNTPLASDELSISKILGIFQLQEPYKLYNIYLCSIWTFISAWHTVQAGDYLVFNPIIWYDPVHWWRIWSRNWSSDLVKILDYLGEPIFSGSSPEPSPCSINPCDVPTRHGKINFSFRKLLEQFLIFLNLCDWIKSEY